MKAGKIIHDLRDLMSTTELVNEAVVVSRLGFADEVIKSVETTTDEEKWPYFTTVIIKKKN